MRHAVLFVALFALGASAQPLLPVPGENFIFTDSSPAAVSMYDPGTQSITPLTTGTFALSSPSGCFVTDQRDVVFGDFLGAAIYKVDVLGNETLLAGGLLNNPIRLTQDYNGDIVFTGNAWAYAPSSLMRVDPTGGVTTLAVLGGNPFDVIRDASGAANNSGDFIVTAPLLGEVLRIDGAGIITVLASGLPGPLGIDRFSNGDFAVAMQFTDEILRIPRNGGTATVFVPSGALGNVKDVISDYNGGFYITEAGGALGSRLMHVDATGAVSQVLGNSSFGLFQAAALAPTLIAPTGVNTGPTGLFGIEISMPSNANLPYMAFMSGSAYPGIQFPGADPRAAVLNPDPLFLGSFGVGAPGVTVGWIGSLDGAGSGLILIDLTPFPVGALSGGRVQMQVATLDALAPTGISNLSSLSTLAFP